MIIENVDFRLLIAITDICTWVAIEAPSQNPKFPQSIDQKIKRSTIKTNFLLYLHPRIYESCFKNMAIFLESEWEVNIFHITHIFYNILGLFSVPI